MGEDVNTPGRFSFEFLENVGEDVNIPGRFSFEFLKSLQEIRSATRYVPKWLGNGPRKWPEMAKKWPRNGQEMASG